MTNLKNAIWQQYCHVTENLNNLSVVVEVNPELWEGHSRLQIGVGFEELEVIISNHSYRPMHTVTVKPVMGEETKRYFEENPDDPKIQTLKEWWESDKVFTYNIHTSAWGKVTKELDRIFNGDPSLLKEEITYLNNTQMKDVQDLVKHGNRYCVNLINPVPDFIVKLPDYSDEYIEHMWGETTGKDVKGFELKVNKLTDSISDQLAKVGNLITTWGLMTKTPKVSDKYVTFKIEDYRIEFCIDDVPYKNDEAPKVDRTPISIEGWSQEDRVYIEQVLTYCESIQSLIDEMMRLGDGVVEGISSMLKPMYMKSVYRPLYSHMSTLWSFTEDSDEATKLVEGEMEYVLTLVEEKSKELGVPVYLDTENWLLHKDGDFKTQLELPYEDQTVTTYVEKFMGSFFNYFKTKVQLSNSELLKPLVAPTAFDPDATNVIDTTIKN